MRKSKRGTEKGKPDNKKTKPKLNGFQHLRKTFELSEQARKRLLQHGSVEENHMPVRSSVYSKEISQPGHSHLRAIYHIWGELLLNDLYKRNPKNKEKYLDEDDVMSVVE